MRGDNVVARSEPQHHALRDDQYDASSDCHQTRKARKR